MAVGLTQSMLNEQPPDDGHRMNILSSTFTHIGIAVYRDSSGSAEGSPPSHKTRTSSAARSAEMTVAAGFAYTVG
jgi:hypothetical protein